MDFNRYPFEGTTKKCGWKKLNQREARNVLSPFWE
jgi:hypothetical protein